MKLLPRTRALAVAGALAATATLTGGSIATGSTAVAASDCGSSSTGGSSARTSDGEAVDADTMSPARAKAFDAFVAKAARSGAAKGQSTITINVRAHIIKGSTGGGISAQGVKDTVTQLNKAYSGNETANSDSDTRFRFTLYSTDTTVNDQWLRNTQPGNVNNRVMKQKLHKGGARSLNIYFVRFSNNLLGYATFPDEYAGAKKLDGVVVDARTKPGGKAGNYNQGDTATHEVGHWLGLRHVFSDEGGASACLTDNDNVTDTPIQADPSAGCPTNADTCPTQPGLDNIHNYMDYSYDKCMYLFTDGQTTAMRNAYFAYRAEG